MYLIQRPAEGKYAPSEYQAVESGGWTQDVYRAVHHATREQAEAVIVRIGEREDVTRCRVVDDPILPEERARIAVSRYRAGVRERGYR